MSEEGVAALKQHVQGQGATIEEESLPGMRRFVLSKSGRVKYLDIDNPLWPDVTLDWLCRQADIAMSDWK